MIKDYSNVARMHTPITKQELKGSPSGPVTIYKLTDEELSYYRSLRPPEKKGNIETVAYQSRAKGLR